MARRDGWLCHADSAGRRVERTAGWRVEKHQRSAFPPHPPDDWRSVVERPRRAHRAAFLFASSRPFWCKEKGRSDETGTAFLVAGPASWEESPSPAGLIIQLAKRRLVPRASAAR